MEQEAQEMEELLGIYIGVHYAQGSGWESERK